MSRTGEPAYYPEVPDELLVAAAVDDEHLALIRSIGMRSAMVVPLAVRGRKLGALTLVQAESERRFDHADLAFARAAGGDRGQSRSTTPASTRSSGAPRTPCRPRCCRPTSPRCPGCASPRATAPPPTPTCSSAATSTTSCRSADGCGVVVADVCGKGAAAAALTALIRHTVRAEIDHGLGPAVVLERLNRAMLRASGGRPGRFATVAQARITRTPSGATVRLASAGHPPPLVVRDGRAEARVRAGHPARRLPGRHLDRGDVRPAPRRDHGALHRWCDGGAGRGRALRAGTAGARGRAGRPRPTRSPTASSPTSTRSSTGSSATTSRSS